VSKNEYSEDQLIQAPTAELLEKQLGWQSVLAYNEEDFGPDSLLGRTSDAEVVLTREAGDAFVLSFWLGDADGPPPAEVGAEGGLNEIPEYLMVEEVA